MFSSLRHSSFAVVCAAALAACGGDKGTTAPPVTPGFSVSLSSSTLTVEQGATGTVTATIARTGSFSGTVNLSTESVPSGITASFSPAAVTSGTTATTLSVTAASNVVPGPYSFTIRGQGAGINDQKTATVSITVTARPAIAIAIAPVSASVVQGGTGSFAATIARTNFTGAVTVAVTGAPPGVSAVVAAVGDVHTATLTVAASTAPGPYTLTVTASGTGVTAVTGTFALTVTAPAASISLVASPNTLTVQAGGTGQSTTVSITRTNFTGAVSLVVLSGAPTGVTTSIVSSPTTTNSMVVTFAAGAATTPGTYPIVLQASGTGIANVTASVSLTVTAASAGSIALSASNTSISTVAGGAGVNLAILITRTSFTGAITFAASGMPAGVTFGSISNSATSETITLTASLTTVPGTYPITITASGTGIASATLQLSLTVNPPPGITLSASVNPLSVLQGGSGSTTINIARNNFTNSVAFSASGLPTGVTAAFNTAATTTNSSILTLAVAATVVAGPYPITVTATSFGIANATLVVNLNVTQAGGGNVAYSFCGQTSNIPIWFAAQSGVSGAWTQVAAGANNTYSFNISGVGGVAWVTQNATNDFDLTVVYSTQSEFAAQGPSNCLSPVFKTVTGTVSGFGLTNSDNVSVSLGNAFASPPPTFASPNFTIANVTNGLQDLVGTRSSFNIANPLAGFALNRLFIKRGLNPANGSSVGTVDFGSSTDAFDPISLTLTVNGATAGEQVSASAAFVTANGSFASLGTSLPGTATTLSFFAVPASRTVAGDVHNLFAFAATISNNAAVAARTVTAAFTNPANQTLTLGAALNTPTVTVLATTPYVKVRTQLAKQSDYQNYWTWASSQGNGSLSRSAITQMSAAYLGSATTVDVSTPDFSMVGGWLNTWGLQAGLSTIHNTSASGWVIGNGGLTDGAVIRNAFRNTTFTP